MTASRRVRRSMGRLLLGLAVVGAAMAPTLAPAASHVPSGASGAPADPGPERLPVEVQRIGGADRYETAVLTVLASFEDRCWIEESRRTDGNPDPEAVARCSEVASDNDWVLARGDSFADALALASTGRDPLLITPGDGLPPAMEVLRGRIGNTVAVLGGADVIAPAVDQQVLDGFAVRLTRHDGATRYETAAAAAREKLELNTVRSTPFAQVLIADGEDWPDALGAGMLAMWTGVVLPVQTDHLPAPIADLLADVAGRETQITIVGGTAAVSAEVMAQVDALTRGPIRRVAGPDRHATARALASVFLAETPGVRFRSGIPEQSVVIMRPDSFADALVAPNLHTRVGPVLLAESATALGEGNAEWLREHADRVAVVTGLGSPDVLADAVLEEARLALCEGGARCS